jgi:hypothetical protein
MWLGKYPYFVGNRLNRTKLDANREIKEATFGDPVAVSNNRYYHHKIANAIADLVASGAYAGVLVIDIHGQSHSHNLTELGYNITGQQLDSDSYALERTSSVKFAAKKIGNSHNLIIGNVSLGYFLERESIRCMPSSENLLISGRSYFHGGYITRAYSSNVSDVIQIELSRVVRFVTDEEFDKNMRGLARGIVNFHRLHYLVHSDSLTHFRVSSTLIMATLFIGEYALLL